MPAFPIPPALKLFSASLAVGGFWTPPEEDVPGGLALGMRFGSVIPESPLEMELALMYSSGTTRDYDLPERLSFTHLDLLTNLLDNNHINVLVGAGLGWRHLAFSEVNGQSISNTLGYKVNPSVDFLLSAGPSGRILLWGPVHLRFDVHGTLSMGDQPYNEGAHAFPGADASISLDLRYEPPSDRDHDSVIDAKDRCPKESEDVDFYDDHDGCIDPDDDKDGIPDIADQCKSQAEDLDGFKDTDGCDDHNNDRDAYPDSLDRCPNEPESENAWEDGDGCPDAVPVDLRGTLARAREIRFDGTTLDPAGEPALLELIAQIAHYPEVVVRVLVYTDSEYGTTAANELTLTQSRQLHAWFAAHGAPMGRLDFLWKGDSALLNSDKTAAEHLLNRRVDLVLVDTVGADGKPIEFTPIPPAEWR